MDLILPKHSHLCQVNELLKTVDSCNLLNFSFQEMRFSVCGLYMYEV